MKKNLLNLVLVAVATFALASCNNPAKMAEAAEQIKIDCVPEVLEVVAGNIDATVTVTFPAEYFHPKAVLEVTPVMLYVGGEVEGTPFRYQGSKVTENWKTVGEDGASITEKVHFDFVPGMEKSELVGRAKVIYKGQEYEYPADIKIADGCITTYMLVDNGGYFDYKKDNYQEVIPETAEAQILYMINNADVRNSELKSADIKDYTEALKALANDERREIKGTDIVAYASPDGPAALNDKLSANREKSAKKAFDKVTKKLETGDVNTKSIGEDWEGFQELVNNSNIEDKDLIIRVLSMYSDPNVREREIKNMSSVYQSLAEDVLPQLRRARFITNVEYTNFTADELKDLVENNIDVLDEEALLRAATLVKDAKSKLEIYKQAIKKFDSDRAKFNAAVTCLNEGEDKDAKSFINKIDNKDCKCVKNLLGVLAMREGDNDAAAKYFKESGNEAAKANLGVLDILNGKYADAAKKLEGVGGHNEGLAKILNGDLEGASKVLKCKCPTSSYLRAVVAARKGDVETAKKELEAAKKNADLEKRAANDVEFLQINK